MRGMLMAIDVGNTNMVFGLFRQKELVGSFRLGTDPCRTADEIGLLVWDYFRRFGWDAGEVEDVAVASVVPPVMRALNEAMTKYFGCHPLVVDVDMDPGLPYEIRGDERLGTDRSAAAIAAMAKYGTPLVVLDFGTATTVDAISTAGGYLGGSIAAGVALSAEALTQKAALLPRVELKCPGRVLGSSAVGQIQAGVMLGYIGAMEYLIRRTKEEMGGGEIRVVATGGLAHTVAENTPLIDIVDDDLVPEGLRLIYCRHKDGR